MELDVLVGGARYSVPLWLLALIFALALVGAGTVVVWVIASPKTLSIIGCWVGWRIAASQVGHLPDVEDPSLPWPRPKLQL